MPAIVINLMRAAALLTAELLAFFHFYNNPSGKKAVYFSWYAWIIDTLAILSGTSIMWASIYALHHPLLFTIHISSAIFWIGFLIGSWQAGIHAVKFLIRIFVRLHT